MISRFPALFLVFALTLTACGHYQKKPDIEDAQYWQRENATSALYLRGPKAQQTLHMHISECVTQLRELDKLGEIKRAIPAEYADDGVLDAWDTPERDGYLYSEHSDFHDFETCMNAKGWERVEYLPYTEAERARQDYLKRYSKKTYKTRKSGREVVTSVNQPAVASNGTSAPTFNE